MILLIWGLEYLDDGSEKHTGSSAEFSDDDGAQWTAEHDYRNS